MGPSSKHTVVIVKVPKNKQGKVIGRRGATIEDIESDYPGVKVIVPQRDDPSEDVRLEGPPDAVENARMRVLDICGMAPDVTGGARAQAQKLFDEADVLYDKMRNASSRQEKDSLRKQAEAKRDKAFEAQKRAADAIFASKNRGYGRDQMDLHGLYVKEAMGFVEERLQQVDADLRSGNLESLTIITGAGHHSDENGPKIKPKVEALLKERNYPYEEDPTGGMYIVSFGGAAAAKPQAQPVPAPSAPTPTPEPAGEGEKKEEKEDKGLVYTICKCLLGLCISALSGDKKKSDQPKQQQRSQQQQPPAEQEMSRSVAQV